jgi:hypothetical protein
MTCEQPLPQRKHVNMRDKQRDLYVHLDGLLLIRSWEKEDFPRSGCKGSWDPGHVDELTDMGMWVDGTRLGTRNAVFWDMTPCRSYKNQSFGKIIASIVRVRRIGELGTTLTVTSNRSTLRRNVTSPTWHRKYFFLFGTYWPYRPPQSPNFSFPTHFNSLLSSSS